jgi:hypothetical protein
MRRDFNETLGIKKPGQGEYDFISIDDILKTMFDD